MPSEGCGSTARFGQDAYSRAPFGFSFHAYRARPPTAPNMMVTGGTGSAKSTLLKTIAFQGVPFGVRFLHRRHPGRVRRARHGRGIPGPGRPRLGGGHEPARGHPPVAGQGEDGSRSQIQRARRLLLLWKGSVGDPTRWSATEAGTVLVEYSLDAVTRER